MLPDRARFYDSLKNYNALQHVKSPMYGLQQDEVKYYKREGEPGNYRYYWTKEEWDAHVLEQQRIRENNMKAAQNAEADRWKKNDQNKQTQQQINNNAQASQNYEADRWKKNDQNKMTQQQINNNAKASQNAEADRWKLQKENEEKEKQRLETIKKNATAAQHDGDRYDRYKQEREAQANIKKNEGNNPEADRYNAAAKKREHDETIARIKKESAERMANKEREDIINKNKGNNPEAERYKKPDASTISINSREAAEKKSRDENVKYNESVSKINEWTKDLKEDNDKKEAEYNKDKEERQTKLNEKKDDLFEMTNYYRKKNSNEKFDEEFEKAKKSAGAENLYIHGGDIKYYDKEAEDKIDGLKKELEEYRLKNGELGEKIDYKDNSNRDNVSNKNQYQYNYNKIRELEREIEQAESDLRRKAYNEYENVLELMYMEDEKMGYGLQSGRERKQLEKEQWLKEQEDDNWFKKVKKKIFN